MQPPGRNSVPLHIPARYMLVAIVSMIAWIALAPWMLPELLAAPLSDTVVAWTHLLTLGCIGSMILGASIQLVPVALQTPFPATRLAAWSWFLWLAGIVLFEAGFSRSILPILVPGASLLGIVLVGYAVAITTMIRRSPVRDTVAWHLLAASWLAVIGFVLGWLMALTNVNGLLGGKLLPILAAHIVVMVAGWVGLTLLGVGYKLIGMFTLAERSLDQVRANLSGACIVVGAVVTLASIAFSGPRAFITAASGLMLWGVMLAGLEVYRMYSRRMRKAIDIHMPFAIIAVVTLVMAAASFVVISLEPAPLANPLTVATVWLALTGAFLVAIQGFFYKISTFLIWLHTYAPLAGTMPVPPLDSMYNRRIAYIGLISWVTSVLAVTAMLLSCLPGWWVWSAGVWIGGSLFVVNVIQIGRHWRGPIYLNLNSPNAHTN